MGLSFCSPVCEVPFTTPPCLSHGTVGESKDAQGDRVLSKPEGPVSVSPPITLVLGWACVQVETGTPAGLEGSQAGLG